MIIFLFFNNNIVSKIFLFDTYINYKNEITKIEKYFDYCNDGIGKIKKNKKIKNPRVSIISPIYNREKFISRFIGNIQNQSFKDIEIIFVDDNSIDNGIKIIEKYKKKDKRIILIKNKKNKGTFVARNLGVLISKAKYVIIPDPDDIISKDIIGICYKYGEKHQYDIIRFNIYSGKGKVDNENFIKFQKSRPIYQPELSTYIFYGNNELELIDNTITNKFIKTKIYIESLNSLNNYYLNMYMTSKEDSLMNFILLRTAKSFYFLKRIGYNYKRTNESISKKLFLISQKQIKFIFIFLKLTFEYSKNTKYEKDILNLRLTHWLKNFDIKLKKIDFNKDFYFYYEVINMIMNCLYISDENLNLLINLKKLIEKKIYFHK
jgi:glycosyltransferase involved in cell wall biosynthesis